MIYDEEGGVRGNPPQLLGRVKVDGPKIRPHPLPRHQHYGMVIYGKVSSSNKTIVFYLWPKSSPLLISNTNETVHQQGTGEGMKGQSTYLMVWLPCSRPVNEAL